MLLQPKVDRLERNRRVGKLIAVAEDGGKSRWIRRDAVAALGRLGDARAAEPLARILAKPYEDSDVHAAAAEALGQIGDVRSLEVLLTALSDPVAAVRIAGVEAVARFGPVAIAPLAALASEGAPMKVDTACGVASTLGRIGGVDAMAALEDLLHDARPKVRDAAHFELRQGGWSPRTPYQRAVVAIFERRWEAAGREGEEAVTLLISELPKDPAGASRALVATGDRRGLEAVGTLVQSGSDRERREAAEALSEASLETVAAAEILMTAAGRIPPGHDGRHVMSLIQDTLPSLARSADPQLRLQAVRAVGVIGLEKATNVLSELCADDAKEVRNATFRFLGERPLGEADIVVPLLRQWCDEPAAGSEARASLKRFESRLVDSALAPGDLSSMVWESMFAVEYLVRTGRLDDKMAARLSEALKRIESICRSEDRSHGYTTYLQIYGEWLHLVRRVLEAHRSRSGP